MNIISNKIGVASVLGSSVLSVTPLMAQKQSQPNVLMVVVDDWGANDLSFSGSKFYETPHIDQLTKEATTFNQ
ncbi:MAG: sulfatase-like hydrolase/transferase, partial [Bacteroidales bacterium]